MRRACRRAILGAAIWLGLATAAMAACQGRDLIELYRASEPAGIEAVFDRAAEVPNSEGRFWRVAAPNVPDSYLFGTFHAAEGVPTVSDEVWNALSAARIAIFEVDPEEKAAMDRRVATDPAFVFDPYARPLEERLPAGTVEDVAAALRARGMSLADVRQIRPWLLVSLLGLPVCQLQSAAAGAEPLDSVMINRAIAAGVPVAGLEVHEESVAAFNRIGPAVLLQAIATSAATDDIAEDLFHTHARLYAAGKITAIEEFGIWLTERKVPTVDARAVNDAVMAELLGRRNELWLPRLIQEVSRGNAFIGVGALHLPGEDGLVELLRAEGFDVMRLD